MATLDVGCRLCLGEKIMKDTLERPLASHQNTRWQYNSEIRPQSFNSFGTENAVSHQMIIQVKEPNNDVF